MLKLRGMLRAMLPLMMPMQYVAPMLDISRAAPGVPRRKQNGPGYFARNSGPHWKLQSRARNERARLAGVKRAADRMARINASAGAAA